jgi:mRNA-degrading endonuclease toxin of MazEF toxin-antitoxin module
VEGSEQGGNRPVVIFSCNAINAASPVVVVIPCTTEPSSPSVARAAPSVGPRSAGRISLRKGWHLL